MKKIFFIIAFALMVASSQLVYAQELPSGDQPCSVRFPTSLDTLDSLCRVKNNSHSNLTTSITTGSTSITVTDASSFPVSGALTIDSEIIFFTTKTGNTFSGLTRGAISTTAAAHNAGVIVRSPILAIYHETLANAIVAVQTKIGSGSSIDALKIGVGTVNNTKFGYLSNVTSDIQSQLDAKALSTGLTSEAGTRATADTTLQTNITAEASTRASADTTLQSNITSEASTRAAADASLQPLDSDLTSIGSLAPSNDDIIQRKSGAWINRTPAQFKADLSIASGDVSGLGTAATRNVAASGDASSGEVVKGDDTRLTNARTPTTHNHTASQITDFNSAVDARIGSSVTSVFGRTGAVVAATNDYTWAQINKSASSIADLATRSASDLNSGTLPDARFPSTLPALNGSNLTALNATNIGSGTVPTARLGSGTASSSTFLRGDNTWQSVSASPAGSDGQIQFNNAGAFAADSGLAIIGTGATLDLNIGRDVTAGRDVAVPFDRAFRFGGFGASQVSYTYNVGPVFYDENADASLIFNLQGLSSNRMWTFPNASDTFVGLSATQTLTNKSLTSPALTGTPTAPTATAGTNTTQIATTAFVQAALPAASLYNALTLQNSWASAGGAWGSPTYSKMGNLVCWQGLLTSGSNATVVFTLPAAARPNADTILTTSSENSWARFNVVASTGAVTVNNWTGASVLSLSGVCYVVP
jgi:hypothetical protein